MVPKETMITSDTKFIGNIITVNLDRVSLANGNVSSREVVRHVGATAIVVQREDGKILLEKQYRYPLDEVILEIPAGKLDSHEDNLICAQRELKEETGITAKEWHCLGPIVTTPGFCDEVITIYLAKQIEFGQPQWDEDEYVEVEWYTFQEIKELMIEGKLKDGKTLAALFMAQSLL